MLFTAHGGADQVLDRIGGRFIPLFGERAAARPEFSCPLPSRLRLTTLSMQLFIGESEVDAQIAC